VKTIIIKNIVTFSGLAQKKSGFDKIFILEFSGCG
jgi:hypothetical protein